jgi:hypothetical protein
MSVYYNKQSLKEQHKKQAEKEQLRKLPEQLATIEDSLCELDAAVNK